MAKFKRWEHFMLPRVGPTENFFKTDAGYNADTNYYAKRSLKSCTKKSKLV